MRLIRVIALIVSIALFARLLDACAPAAKRVNTQYAAPAGSQSPPRPAAPETLPPLPAEPAAQARTITNYLKSHRLPLVGVNVVEEDGRRQAILYGFVATPFGRQDAEQKTRGFFRDSKVEIVNRIIVEPQLLEAKAKVPSPAEETVPSAGPSPSQAYGNYSPAAENPDIAAYQQYQGGGYQPPRPGTGPDVLLWLLVIASMFVP